MREIKQESEKLDKDIEKEIDARNTEITEYSQDLLDVLREKQDLKWRVNALESEVNNLEFQKNKLELELDIRNLKDNKGDLMQKLNQRIDDANYNERHIRDM